MIVPKDPFITRGQRPGGDTGNSGAPHLHVEIRTADGVARCPQPFLLAIHDGVPPPSLPTTGCTS